MGRFIIGLLILGLIVAVGAAVVFIGGAVYKGISSNKSRSKVKKGVDGYALESYSAKFYGLKVVPLIAKEDYEKKINPALEDNTSLNDINLDFSEVFQKYRIQATQFKVSENSDGYADQNQKDRVSYGSVSPDEWGELYRLYLDAIESHIKNHTRLQTSLRKVDDGKADRVLKKAETNRRALEELRSQDGEWDFLIQKKTDKELG